MLTRRASGIFERRARNNYIHVSLAHSVRLLDGRGFGHIVFVCFLTISEKIESERADERPTFLAVPEMLSRLLKKKHSRTVEIFVIIKKRCSMEHEYEVIK